MPQNEGGNFARVDVMLGRWVVYVGDGYGFRIKGTWKSKEGAEAMASNINMHFKVFVDSRYRWGEKERGGKA